MGARVSRRKLMRLAAAGLSSALVPLSGCARQVGQKRGTTHFPTPDAPLTPTASWYFMSILGAYEADRERYRLKVGGVSDDLSLSIAELEALPSVVEPITLACVGNAPGGALMSSAYFRGARLRDLIELAAVKADASGAFITGLDGFVAYQSMEDLARGESIVAYQMGLTPDALEPLPIEHGFPCRILTPGLYGYMQPKWIDTLTFVDQGGYQSVVTKSIPYFEGKMQLASGFSRPRGGAVPTGSNEVLGYAFGDGRLVAAVEVQVDDGPWQPAQIVYNERDDELPSYLWVLWRFVWNATAGEHRLRCRARYQDGATQFDGMNFPYSGGSITRVVVRAEEPAP